MDKKNITPVVIGIVVLLAVLGAGIAIKFSGKSTVVENASQKSDGYCDIINDKAFALEENNTASEIGEGEIKLTCDNFKSEVEDSKGVIMVDMYSPTCPHCQKIGPVISELAKEIQGKYKVGKINVLAYSSIGTKYEIESVPALLFFKDGKEVKRLIGEQTKEKMLATLEEVSK